jgi:ferric iron reductase protein FhuF
MTDEDLIGDDTEYFKYKKIMNIMGTAFYEIKNLEQKLVDMQVSFEDTQRAHAVGVQNVYASFSELEERQKNIENLLNGDHIKEMIKSIPNEDSILKMLDMVENHPISLIKSKINCIRDDLEELTDRFTL